MRAEAYGGQPTSLTQYNENAGGIQPSAFSISVGEYVDLGDRRAKRPFTVQEPPLEGDVLASWSGTVLVFTKPSLAEVALPKPTANKVPTLPILNTETLHDTALVISQINWGVKVLLSFFDKQYYYTYTANSHGSW